MRQEIYAEIEKERLRQNEKWGEQNHPIRHEDGYSRTCKPYPFAYKDEESEAKNLTEFAFSIGKGTFEEILKEEVAEIFAADGRSDPGTHPSCRRLRSDDRVYSEKSEMIPDRPVLKYNGGKWIDGKWIISHFPKHRIYADLFGGGGSVLLQKPRAKIEYYNDLDSNVHTFFKVLRERPKELIRAIRWTPYSRDTYDNIKGVSSDDEIQKALYFCIRCWMGRGNNLHSSFRTRGNVYGEGRYIPAKLWSDLRPYYQAAYRLRGVAIENKDWFELAKQIDGPETLLYIDPPYPKTVRNGAKLYDHDIRSEQEHSLILRSVLTLESMIVVSSYPNDLYSSTLKGWTMVTKKSTDDQRRERIEALYVSPNAANQDQPDLFGAG